MASGVKAERWGVKRRTLQLLLAERILVLVKIKESIRDRRCRGLVFRVVVRLQVRVTKGILDGDTLGRVEGKQFLQQVESQVVALGEQGLERDLLLERQRADVFSCPARFDSVVVFHCWCSQHIEDKSQLVVVYYSMLESINTPGEGPGVGKLTVFPRKQRLSAQHLGQYAAHTPYVNGFCVFLEGQHDFRRTVPASRHVFRHESRVVVGGRCRTSQTEVADFQITVGVQQQVRRFQVSVQHVGRVHRFERSQRLVDEVLAVVVREVLRPDNTMHVGFHQFLYY